MSQYIIDEIQPTAWRLRIRDEATGKTEEVALRPGEPWKVRVGAATKAAPPDAKPPKAEPEPRPTEAASKPTEPPPKDLRLSLENGSGNTVIATAHGRGAAAWAKTQKRLLGRKWDETAEGNAFVMLRNSPTLLEDLARALPGVRLDTTHYTPPGTPAAEKSKDEPPAKDVKPEKSETKSEAKSEESPKPARMRKAGGKDKRPGRRPKLQPGTGPGDLEWSEMHDAGNRGIVARWHEGQFKILRAGSGVYALFYEYERGGYEQLACGKPDQLKQVASARTASTGPRVTEALARGACNTCTPAKAPPAANDPPKRPTKSAHKEEPTEPPPAEPTPPPTDEAAKDAALMSGFRKELAGIFDEDDE